MDTPLRQLTYHRHPHTFVLRYHVGDEAALLRALLANDLLDAFDLSIIATQIGYPRPFLQPTPAS
jgi:hypothetical protein